MPDDPANTNVLLPAAPAPRVLTAAEFHQLTTSCPHFSTLMMTPLLLTAYRTGLLPFITVIAA